MRTPLTLAIALVGAGAATAIGTASTEREALNADISTWRGTVDSILHPQRDPPERRLEPAGTAPGANARSAPSAETDKL